MITNTKGSKNIKIWAKGYAYFFGEKIFLTNLLKTLELKDHDPSLEETIYNSENQNLEFKKKIKFILKEKFDEDFSKNFYIFYKKVVEYKNKDIKKNWNKEFELIKEYNDLIDYLWSKEFYNFNNFIVFFNKCIYKTQKGLK